MFAQLIEAIRTESSQSGSSKERTPGEGIYRSGPMTHHAGKLADLKADKKKRRRMGRRAAEVGDTEFNVGKPGGKKKPIHPRPYSDMLGGRITPAGRTHKYFGKNK